MSLKLGKPKMPPSEPRKDEERETREAVVQDADKTEDKTATSCTAMAERSVSARMKIKTRTIKVFRQTRIFEPGEQRGRSPIDVGATGLSQ